MKRELDSIGKVIKESLSREVQESNKQIEAKLNKFINKGITYADTVRNEDTSIVCQTKPPEIEDFRSIMRKAKNEELAVESERKRRANNIIIYGVKEAIDVDKNGAKEHDEKYVKSFIETVKVATTFKSVLRLGKFDPAKIRPSMVIFHSENDINLKGNEDYKGVSVTEDYTLTDRKTIREWREKAKTANDQEPADSKYVYRVRGSPKNGWGLKKFLKLKIIAQH